MTTAKKAPAKKVAAKKKAAPRTAAVVQKELDAFKEAVKAEAQGYVDRGASCVSGVNDFLEAVGLEPLKESFEIRVTFSRDIEAKNYTEAADIARMEADNMLPPEWEVYDADAFGGY